MEVEVQRLAGELWTRFGETPPHQRLRETPHSLPGFSPQTEPSSFWQKAYTPLPPSPTLRLTYPLSPLVPRSNISHWHRRHPRLRYGLLKPVPGLRLRPPQAKPPGPDLPPTRQDHLLSAPLRSTQPARRPVGPRSASPGRLHPHGRLPPHPCRSLSHAGSRPGPRPARRRLHLRCSQVPRPRSSPACIPRSRAHTGPLL